MPVKKKVPILVTTEKKGIFFGYSADLDAVKKAMGANGERMATITDARCCIKFSGTKGFLGLASEGPGDACRIGPAAPELTVNLLTSVTVCSDNAAKAWEKAPWR